MDFIVSLLFVIKKEKGLFTDVNKNICIRKTI